MTAYQPFSPVDIRFASMNEIEQQMSMLENNHVLIIADEGTLQRLEAYNSFYNYLTKSISSYIISEYVSNPSVADVLKYLNLLRKEKSFDYILAIGGGSCIDLAKSISALHGLAAERELCYQDIVDSIQKKTYLQGYEPIDIIALPTTAGTGSEVTKWATVWDFEANKKLSIDNIGCFPKFAYLIPELTESMPKRLTLSTGLDALSHATEAFWAKKRTPLSQSLALASAAHIKKSLPVVLAEPTNLTARTDMCMGSLLAGLAFSITRTTACHSISYPLTLQFGVDHGFASALTLASVFEINKEAVPELSQINSLFGDFKRWISDISQGIQKLKLSEFGICATQ